MIVDGIGINNGAGTGTNNIALGANALEDNTTGTTNTAIGNEALRNNTTGAGNIAFGQNVLTANTTGSGNSALGTNIMDVQTTANSNTGFGLNILRANTTGQSNIAIGTNLLVASTTGSSNVAIGADNQLNTTTGSQNNSIGYGAIKGIAGATGQFNNAMGTNTLASLQTGNNNVAMGNFAAACATTGSGTTAIGGSSLIHTVAGSQNSALSSQALRESTSIIATFGTITAGSGYTDGTYTGVALDVNYTRIINSAVGGDDPIADITVAGGLVTVVTLVSGGKGIRSGTICTIKTSSAPAGLLAGSGFSIPVATLLSADQNTAIGFEAGRLNITGSRNVFLGYAAGRSETTSDNLYISNTNTATPLIYGKFDSTGSTGGRVKINGNLEIKTKTPASATATGVVGEIAWDADYIYICTATDTWKRSAITTW
jgi:hypothetical protein